MKKGVIAEVVGGISTFIILLSYALLNFDYVVGPSFSYQIMNLFGAIGIAYSAYLKKAKQPMLLNIVWSIAAIIAIGGLLI